MNKIFKSIWNKRLGVFVAAGENAKSQTKSSKLKSKLTSSFVSAALLLAAGHATADLITYENEGISPNTQYTTVTYDLLDSNKFSSVNFLSGSITSGAALFYSDLNYSNNLLTTSGNITSDFGFLNLGGITPYENTFINDQAYLNGLISFGADVTSSSIILDGTIRQAGANPFGGADNSGYEFKTVYVEGDLLGESILTNNALIEHDFDYNLLIADSTIWDFIGQSYVPDLTFPDQLLSNVGIEISGTVEQGSVITNNDEIDITALLSIAANYTQVNNNSGVSSFYDNDAGDTDSVSVRTISGYDYNSLNTASGIYTNEIIESAVINNGLINIYNRNNADFLFDYNNFSAAEWDGNDVDDRTIESINLGAINDLDFNVSSVSAGITTGYLIESSIVNNGDITVNDATTFDFDALVGYQNIGATGSTGGGARNAINDPDMENNTFLVGSTAYGIQSNWFNLAGDPIAGFNYDSSITNNGIIDTTAYAEASVVVDELNTTINIENDFNRYSVISQAAGISVQTNGLFDTFGAWNLAVNNSNSISATATTKTDFSPELDYDFTEISARTSAVEISPMTGIWNLNEFRDGVILGDIPFQAADLSSYAFLRNTSDDLGGINMGTTVTNTGVLTATSTLSDSSDFNFLGNGVGSFAEAIGVNMSAINLIGAEAPLGADPFSPTVQTELLASDVGLNNSGTINVSATSTSEGESFAYGAIWQNDVNLAFLLDGNLATSAQYGAFNDVYAFQNQQTGVINVDAQAMYGDALAFGTYASYSQLKWLNDGAIDVSSNSMWSDSFATGAIWVSDIQNDVINNGSISVASSVGEDFGNADAVGLSVGEDFFGVTGAVGEDFFDGELLLPDYYALGEIGHVINNGLIDVEASGLNFGNQISGVGILLSNNDKLITNTGVIRTNVSTGEDGRSIGIESIESSLGLDGNDMSYYNSTDISYINNEGLISSSTSGYGFDRGSNLYTSAISLTGRDINLDGGEGGLQRVDNSGVLVASSLYDVIGGQDFIEFHETYGVHLNDWYSSIVNNSGTIRSYSLSSVVPDGDLASPQTLDDSIASLRTRGIYVQGEMDSFIDEVDRVYMSQINNNVGGYIGALVDMPAFGNADKANNAYAFNILIDDVEPIVAGIEIDQLLSGQINNGDSIGRSVEYYNATVEGFFGFDASALTDEYVGMGGEDTINGYTEAEIDALLGVPAATYNLNYNLESHNFLVSGSKSGRDNYAFVDQEINDGLTTGLRYNLAFKNYLADQGLYGDGGYSLSINWDDNTFQSLAEGEVNNYCYGVFEGAIDIMDPMNTLTFNNEGRINTRLDVSYIESDFVQTNTGILQIALDTSNDAVGVFEFDGDSVITLSETTNIRVSVRDDDVLADIVDGTSYGRILTDWTASGALDETTYVVQDNRLDTNFIASFDTDAPFSDFVTLEAISTGLTTLEDAAARPTKNLGWLLDDYNLLHDADYQTRELNAYLYALGSSENRSEVNAQLHKALPLLAGGNTLSNMQLLNDTRNNIEDRLVSRLDKRVGDVYMGKKNAWFRAFGNDQNQSTRDATAGYDSKALGGTFGIDNMVGDTLIGAAFTYARNDVDGSSHFNGQEGKTRTWDLALYGSTPVSADKRTYVNYQVGGGIMDTSTRREFFDLNCCNAVVASGNYDTKFARASINLNHRVDLTKQTSFTPSAGLTYTYMDEDSYTEKGAGDLKLHVKSNQTDQALATIAGRFDFYPTDGVRLYASALAGYDMINEQVDLKANFVNLVDSAFTTKGIDQSPWMGNARAGVSVNVGDVELNAGYGYTYRSDFDNHTATLRALYSF